MTRGSGWDPGCVGPKRVASTPPPAGPSCSGGLDTHMRPINPLLRETRKPRGVARSLQGVIVRIESLFL